MQDVRRPWLWTALFAALPLLGWWTYGLFDLDEGFYAAIAAEMNRRGEWITPFYNGKPWFEKPILLYWLAKPSLALFGEMVGPRLASILASVGMYVLLARFARWRMGEVPAMAAVLAASTSLLPVAAGRMMLTDTLLVLALTGALLAFWEAISTGEAWWKIAAAACLGLAILAKGPVAGAFFLLIAALAYWRLPSMRPGFRGGWLAGTTVLVLFVAAWYVPCYLANREAFVKEFLIEQNIGRFQGGDRAHKVGMPLGLIFYLPVLALGMAPWIFRLGPKAAFLRGRDPLETYLWIWAGTVFAFFTLSGSKLPHYVLPAVPPLALLLGLRWGELPLKKLLTTGGIASLAIFGIAQGGFSLYYYGGELAGQRVAGFHAEVHRAARFLHDQDGKVAVYQMPKRKGKRSPGLRIEETSHPSILLYLGRNVSPVETLEELAEERPAWVLTRTGRISEVDLVLLRELGLGLAEVEIPGGSEFYRLFRVR